jgi:hypothetical protein
MDTNIYKQLLFLVSQNTGIKLEKIIEQVLESNIYSMNEILENENVKNVNFYNSYFSLVIFYKFHFLVE